jgi:hypothetical protein
MSDIKIKGCNKKDNLIKRMIRKKTKQSKE